MALLGMVPAYSLKGKAFLYLKGLSSDAGNRQYKSIANTSLKKTGGTGRHVSSAVKREKSFTYLR